MKDKFVKIADALSGVSVSTWAILVTILLAVTNAIMTATGHNPINVSDDAVYQYVSFALAFASVGYGIWKNISFTKGAQTTDEILKLIKLGLLTAEEVQKYINKVKEEQNSSADISAKTIADTKEGE